MTTQQALMTHCPATGSVKPYPSHAEQWRKYHGTAAWLFNPWTGGRRHALDVGSDPFGMAVHLHGEPVYDARQFASGGGSLADSPRQVANHAGNNGQPMR